MNKSGVREKGKEIGVLRHNLPVQPESFGGLMRTFKENYEETQARKKGLILHHVIISLGRGEKENARNQELISILLDLGEKFLEKFAPDFLAYGRVHLNTECPHLHLMISAHPLSGRKKLRKSKAQFEKIKRDLDAYQKEKYPRLTKSLAYEAEKGKENLSKEEHERKRRLEREGEKEPSKKEMVKKDVIKCLGIADSREELIQILKLAGLEHYQRGETAGVLCLSDKKKYRFKTLGIEEEYQRMLNLFRELEKNKELLREKEREEKNHGRIQETQNGVRNKIEKLLGPLRLMGRALSQKLSPLFHFWSNRKERQKEDLERTR